MFLLRLFPFFWVTLKKNWFLYDKRVSTKWMFIFRRKQIFVDFLFSFRDIKQISLHLRNTKNSKFRHFCDFKPISFKFRYYIFGGILESCVWYRSNKYEVGYSVDWGINYETRCFPQKHADTENGHAMIVLRWFTRTLFS